MRERDEFHIKPLGAEQRLVVELALVHEHVRVGVGRDGEVPLPDPLADPRPRDPAQVQQRDAPVAQLVRAPQVEGSRCPPPGWDDDVLGPGGELVAAVPHPAVHAPVRVSPLNRRSRPRAQVWQRRRLLRLGLQRRHAPGLTADVRVHQLARPALHVVHHARADNSPPTPLRQRQTASPPPAQRLGHVLHGSSVQGGRAPTARRRPARTPAPQRPRWRPAPVPLRADPGRP